MSRNFELMHQTVLAIEATAIRRERREFSTVREEASQNEARFDLLQVGREEILRLVQRIFLLQTQKAPRAVLFAGINQGTGCSEICLLVAETLRASVSGSVCLVEANFRSPSLPNKLGTTNHHGLTDALLHEGPIRSFARPMQRDNLWLLSCGLLTADSPNLLNSERIRARFEELREEFDYLVVDAPSLTQYADATALGRVTDGLVLVLEANSTRKEAALRVMENLRAAQIQVLGAVLNKRTFPIPESLYHRL
ncbi:MAG: CpsD/CapB family tyrosine-protein kinase [Candidatus Acidiferrales bacterium]